MRIDSIQLREGGSVTNLVVPTGTSFPDNANDGELFYRSDENKLYIYLTDSWTDLRDATALGGNASSHFLDWANFTGQPTTIAGYGITDAGTSHDHNSLYLGLGGGTLTGALAVEAGVTVDRNGDAASALLTISGDTGQTKRVAYQTSGTDRWLVGPNNTAEAGSNAGSDFTVVAYDDIGSSLGAALTITRATGKATFSDDVSVTGAFDGVGNITTTGGNLQVNRNSDAVDAAIVVTGDAGQQKYITLRTQNSNRWSIQSNSTPESGSNAGSNFNIVRHGDDGISDGVSLAIDRASGLVTVGGDPTAALGVATKQYADNNFLGLAGGTLTGALTLSGDPTNANHAASKAYVDALINGLDAKGSVRGASTTNVSLTGALTHDDVVYANGDRFLAKDQTDETENGIYLVNTSGAWTRSEDADNSPGNEVSGGMFCYVDEGTANAGTAWLLSAPAGDASLGVDDLVFVKFNQTADHDHDTDYVNVGGDTMTGALLVEDDIIVNRNGESVAGNISIRADAGYDKNLFFRDGGNSARWAISSNTTGETGSDAGSNLDIYRYDDAGSFLGTAVRITRSNGDMTVFNNLSVQKDLAVDRIGNTANASAYISGDAGYIRGVRLRTGTSHRWLLGANNTAETGSDAGSDFTITNYDDAGSIIGTPLTIYRASGQSTFGGNITLNRTSASTDAILAVSGDAGYNRTQYFRTGASNRWAVGASNEAETGSHAGSNFGLYRYDDSGVYVDSPLSVTRSTGDVAIENNLTVGGVAIVDRTGDSDHSVIRMNGDAGYTRGMRFNTGSSRRWLVEADSAAESGSNAGSDFRVGRFDDSGTHLGDPLVIDRADGNATFGGNLFVSKTGIGAFLYLQSDAGYHRGTFIRSGNSQALQRWYYGANIDAESGSDAGSNFVVRHYDDSGTAISDALKLERSTGAATFSGSITSGGNIEVDRSGDATDALTYIKGDAGYSRVLYFNTGSENRWALYTGGGAESGSDAGSDFAINSYDDNGDFLSTVFGIIRADGSIHASPTYSNTVSTSLRDLQIDSSGYIGYQSSTQRYKENIVDMGDTSWIHNLRPVEFDYDAEHGGAHAWGLIAEEVEQVNDYLITRNAQSQPETVEYKLLIPMLLKEIQTLRTEVDALKAA